MKMLIVYSAAALCEIAGCFAFWAWWRMGKSILWLAPGSLSLLAFGYLLAQVETSHAGRAYAAYGGIYIAAAVAWGIFAEGVWPDRWDLIGTGLCLIGTLVILQGPR